MSERANTGKIAFVFPGIGVDLCGAEADFFRRHEALMVPFLEHASECAGVNFVTLAMSECTGHYGARVNELFSCAFSCAMYAVYADAGLRPWCVAGYSLGVYGAIFASGALSFADCLATVDRAYGFVQEYLPADDFGMGVVLGLHLGEVQTLLSEIGDEQLFLVNSNNESSYVLAGRRATLGPLLERADSLGAFRACLLDIDVPFHNPCFLSAVSVHLEHYLRKLSWSSPVCPVISSIDQRMLNTADELVTFVAKNLSTPISWFRVVEMLAYQEVDAVIECGLGVSLTQSARFIEGAPPHTSSKTSRRRLGL